MQTSNKSIFSKVTDNPLIISTIVLCVGVLSLLFDIFIGGGKPSAKSIAAIAGGAAYLLLRNRILSNLNIVPPVKTSISLSTSFVLNTIFLVLFSYTLFIAITAEAYTIPLSYFIFTTAMCVTVVVEIFLMPEGRGLHTYIILAKIISTSLLLIAIPHYFFPNIGQDPWYHMNLVDDILSGSHIPAVGYQYYRDFTAMHFMIAAVKAVTNLNIQASIMSVGVFQVTSLLCLFCIGKAILNNKVALLGALLAGVSSAFIFWGYYIIPMSLGLGLVPVLIFLIIKSRTSNKQLLFTIFWLLISALAIYTHTISGLILLIIIVSLYLADKFLHFWSRKSLPAVFSFSTPLWFFVALIGYWMYISSYWFGELGKIIAHVFSMPTFEVAGLPSDITPMMLQDIGFTCLLGLGVLGVLYCWEYRKNHRYALLLFATVAGLAMVLFVSGLVGRSELLLPDRWQPFLYVTIAILSAQGIFLIYHATKSKPLRLFIIILITLVLSFTMISIARAKSSCDHPLFSRIAFTFFFNHSIIIIPHKLQ